MQVSLGLGDISLIVEALEHYSKYDGLHQDEGEAIDDLLNHLNHRTADEQEKAAPSEAADIRNMVATVLIQREDGKLLTEWREDGIFAPGTIAFPGGRMKQGETPVMALVREVEEELGISVVFPIVPLGTLENLGYTLHLFLITEWTGTLPQATLDAGHALRWADPRDIAVTTWRPASIAATRAMAHAKSKLNYQAMGLQR